jgi:membrane associated rhomboid family serine protease
MPAPLATYALLGLLAAFFALEHLLGGSEDGRVLIRLGALVPELVRAGQWWRLVSCTVLHAGFMHFAFNAYVLLALGSSLERILGTRRFLVLYWTSALAGSAASAALGGYRLSVGASGALWGLLAAEAALALRPRGLLPEPLVPVARRTAAVNLGINVLNSFRPQIDWAAHFGGGVVGALLLLSGAITRGRVRPTEADPYEGPPREAPSWLSPAAGLLVLLAGAALSVALVRARPWAGALQGADAAFLLEDACAAGDAGSCFNLGLLHGRGDGVAKDRARAAAFFERACDGGEAAGCFNLGVLHAKGEGVPKDLARAAAFYSRACDAGELKGCSNLGVLHANGSGVAKDPSRAAGLYQRACDGGNVVACFNLGLLHETGEGVAKDLARAASLYRRACEGGEAGGCEALKQIESTPGR